MRIQFIFATVSLAACLGASAPQAGKSDQDLIQGDWNLIGAMKQGKAVSQEDIKKMSGMFTFNGDKAVAKGIDPGTGQPTQVDGTFKLDPSKKPKEIELTNSKNETMKGIYELNGDELKIALSPKERPKDFTSGDAATLKRAKK